MKRHDVIVENGFNIKKSAEKIAKEQREERISNRKTADKSKVSIKEVYDFLLDLADRQSEIYDMLKELCKK
jgi:hypothetical protein